MNDKKKIKVSPKHCQFYAFCSTWHFFNNLLTRTKLGTLSFIFDNYLLMANTHLSFRPRVLPCLASAAFVLAMSMDSVVYRVLGVPGGPR